MVFLSSALSYVIGIPLGIALVVTDREGISPVPLFNKVLGLIINLLRSVPFIILLIMVLPITKFIVGKTIGSNATVVPLIIAAAPYIGRMVESSLKEVDAGVIEAAKSMGASTWQIIVKVLLPEAKPSLLVGAAISVTTILGYSAMAGFTGGGGLGAGLHPSSAGGNHHGRGGADRLLLLPRHGLAAGGGGQPPLLHLHRGPGQRMTGSKTARRGDLSVPCR